MYVQVQLQLEHDDEPAGKTLNFVSLKFIPRALNAVRERACAFYELQDASEMRRAVRSHEASFSSSREVRVQRTSKHGGKKRYTKVPILIQL